MVAKKEEKKDVPKMDKKEQIGFHTGCLQTLAKERQELSRILGIVEQLMQMHIGALKELGVDLQQKAEDIQKKGKKPIEDIL
jgi:hypothetical protein